MSIETEPAGSPPSRVMLRWHGAKWRIAPWIISELPPHSGYVEPFGGGLGVLLRKRRVSYELVNDLDSALVNLYRVLRDPAQGARLVEQCALTPFSREEFELAYKPAKEPVEAARRLVLRSFAAVGSVGASRESRSGFAWDSHLGQYSEPAQVWSTYPESLRAVVARLQGVVIENRPALEVVCRTRRDDTIVYCDPPYVASTRGAGAQAYRHEMSDDDHETLAGALHQSRCMVAVSGYDSPLYQRLYEGWERVTCDAETFGKLEGKGRRTRQEVLWFNPAATAARQEAKRAGQMELFAS
jgi:DNA adenine methylase